MGSVSPINFIKKWYPKRKKKSFSIFQSLAWRSLEKRHKINCYLDSGDGTKLGTNQQFSNFNIPTNHLKGACLEWWLQKSSPVVYNRCQAWAVRWRATSDQRLAAPGPHLEKAPETWGQRKSQVGEGADSGLWNPWRLSLLFRVCSIAPIVKPAGLKIHQTHYRKRKVGQQWPDSTNGD